MMDSWSDGRLLSPFCVGTVNLQLSDPFLSEIDHENDRKKLSYYLRKQREM